MTKDLTVFCLNYISDYFDMAHVTNSISLWRSCQIMKNYTQTALNVYFAGNLRIASCDNCRSRWYFTFNSAECSSPGIIDGSFYMANSS